MIDTSSDSWLRIPQQCYGSFLLISAYNFFPSCPEDTIGCRIVFCGWKAKVSTRVQISKFDKAHYQVLCGIPPEEKDKGTNLLLILKQYTFALNVLKKVVPFSRDYVTVTAL